MTQHQPPQPPQQPTDPQQPYPQQPYAQGYPPHTAPPAAPPATRPRRRRRRILLAAGAVVAVLVVAGALSGNDGNGTSAAGDRHGGAGSAAASAAPTKPAAKPRKPRRAGIGQEVRDGKFAFVVTAVDTGLDHVGTDEFTRQTPQGQYVLVHVTVRNIGDEAQLFDASSQKLVDAQGRRYDADSGAAAIALDDNAFLNTINPGNSVRGLLLYDVPKAFAASAIELHDSPFSGGVTVGLTR